MSGALTLDALRDFVKAGEIDNIPDCFPDLQGRLLGTGYYFLDRVVIALEAA